MMQMYRYCVDALGLHPVDAYEAVMKHYKLDLGV